MHTISEAKPARARSSARNPLGFLLQDTIKLMRADFHRRVAEHGITLAQAKALRWLSREPGLRQVDLAEALEIQPMTLVRLIDQLEAAGLVERRIDRRDRRAFRLYLTEGAGPVTGVVERASRDVQRRAFQGLSAAEQAAFVRALEAMKRNLLETGTL